ncbi:GPCPD1 family protein [Megaselia abdita]
MQRWTFVDANTKGLYIETSPVTSLRSKESNLSIGKMRPWTFNVVVNEDLMPNECIAITGSCESLGQWKPGHCVLLDQGEDGTNTWTVTVSIPEQENVQYRYFVCAVVPTTENVIVRRWETHMVPRTVPASAKSGEETKPDLYVPYVDLFGDVKGEEKIDRGWLTSETVVQLKFFNAPFVWKQRVKKRLLYAKITPMSINISGGDQYNNLLSPLEDSLSNDTRENGVESSCFGFSEVTSITRDNHLQQQPQFGWPCGENDLVIFHMTASDPDNTAFLVDLYAYSSKASDDEPPYHLGYHYIMPNAFKHSEGTLDIPITCATKHRPMGMMHLGYLQIKPFKYHPIFPMETTFQRYWNPKWTGLDVGHRGSGTSFKTTDAVIRENTIASLKNAVEHGADMVEFDVQLSKDLVPVIYHDFNVYVSLKSKNIKDANTFLELPMRDLSLEQLKKLKVYHTSEGNSGEERTFHNDELLESQPFPQLAEVLDAIDPHVGFNIEVKWSQKLADGSMEEEQLETIVDRNLYIDCILETVFRKSDKRRIVFSCFDPDICTMLRYKQNRFPVMFLTLGGSDRYQKYKDPRCNSVESAICNARIMELLGVVAHTEDLLRDPTQVNLAKNLGLVVFCWGDDNNSTETIRLLKQLGLHAIIYDKMEVHNVKEVKVCFVQKPRFSKFIKTLLTGKRFFGRSKGKYK